MKIESTLAERRKLYGEYPEHARITQNLKSAMRDSPNWNTLADDQKETLEMIAHKIGRILNGDGEIFEAFLSGQSVSDLAFAYNEPQPVIEDALRREFVRIRDGILRGWHEAIDKQANLENQLADLTYHNLLINR